MPLDLSIPPIVIKTPRRRTWTTRLIEFVLILGITALAISALAPFIVL